MKKNYSTPQMLVKRMENNVILAGSDLHEQSGGTQLGKELFNDNIWDEEYE